MRRKLRVLIIDDDQDFLVQCKQRLEKESRNAYSVDTAVNGAEGLRMAQTGNYHVAVVDMKMPDMDGMEVLRQIRELELNVTPIVLTGFSDIQSAVEAMKMGAADFMTKPLAVRDLMQKIGHALTARELERWYSDRTEHIPPRHRPPSTRDELLQCLQAVTRDSRHIAAVFLGDLILAHSKTARRIKSVFKEQRIPVHMITGVNMVTGKDVIRYLTSNDTVVIASAIDVKDLPTNDPRMPRLSFSEILAEASRLGLSTKVSFVNVDPESPNLDAIFKELF